MTKNRILTDAQKARQRELQRLRRQQNPEKVRAQGRINERRRKLKKYGLTEESFALLWLSQKSKCGICKTPDPGARDWHVDHCHTTGKVRGILCHHCNLMLGNAKDNKSVLLAAINYLNNNE